MMKAILTVVTMIISLPETTQAQCWPGGWSEVDIKLRFGSTAVAVWVRRGSMIEQRPELWRSGSNSTGLGVQVSYGGSTVWEQKPGVPYSVGQLCFETRTWGSSVNCETRISKVCFGIPSGPPGPSGFPSYNGSSSPNEVIVCMPGLPPGATQSPLSSVTVNINPLELTGSKNAGAVSLTASNAVPGEQGFFAFSNVPTTPLPGPVLPFGQPYLDFASLLTPLPALVDASGTASFSTPIPPSLTGLQLVGQFFAFNTNAAGGAELSNGLLITL